MRIGQPDPERLKGGKRPDPWLPGNTCISGLGSLKPKRNILTVNFISSYEGLEYMFILSLYLNYLSL